jgi:hypothetical protein
MGILLLFSLLLLSSSLIAQFLRLEVFGRSEEALELSLLVQGKL